jgi:NAD(P)H-hydrate epimerase
MRAISVAEAQAFDQRAQEELKIPSIILMENAGRSVAEEAIKFVGAKKARVAVICGVGNNGGDGLVAARHLINHDDKVLVYIVGDIRKLKADPKTNLNILMKMGIIIEQWKPRLSAADFLSKIINADLIVDAIFGIGLKSSIKEPFLEMINYLNRLNLPILAVDVPSGLSADTGEVMGAAIKADLTVTFVAPKKGFAKSKAFTGKIIVRDII